MGVLGDFEEDSTIRLYLEHIGFLVKPILSSFVYGSNFTQQTTKLTKSVFNHQLEPIALKYYKKVHIQIFKKIPNFARHSGAECLFQLNCLEIALKGFWGIPKRIPQSDFTQNAQFLWYSPFSPIFYRAIISHNRLQH